MAARLMYDGGVSQYYDAKRMAAKRWLKQGGGGNVWIKDLPSTGEISEALASIADLHEGESRTTQLFAMRVVALDFMGKLSPFEPRLIGSVSTGRIRASSDIDLHVFVDEREALENHIGNLGWVYETAQVAINKNGKIEEYTHIYIEDHFPVELSVYPRDDIRVRGRSSTDGRPIIRLKEGKLQELIVDDHGEYWSRYLETGKIAGID